MKSTDPARSLIPLTLASFAILLCLLLLAKPSSAGPQIVYVSSNDPTCGGHSPCHTNMQAALDAAVDNSTIKVSAGVYRGVSARLAGTRVVTQVALINKSVLIRGGYSTTDWENSYPLTRSTTIDAERKGRGLYIAPGVFVTIEGLTVTNGNASGMSGKFYWPNPDAGGGIYVVDSNLTLRDITLYNNTAGDSEEATGGGLYAEDANDVTVPMRVDVSGSRIISNTARGWGGGLSVGIVAGSINNNIISGNSARSAGGGGIYADGRGLTVSDNVFQNNRADSYMGGGMWISGWDRNITVTHNIVISNSAGNSGGGMHLNADESLVTDNSILSNTAAYGGGLSTYLSQGSIVRNLIAGNTADTAGGGAYLFSNVPFYDSGYVVTLQANTVRDNAAVYGGGIGVEGNISGSVTLNGNTITHNSASERGGGVQIGLFSSSPGPQVTIADSTIAGNTAGTMGGGISEFAGRLSLDRSFLKDNHAGNSGGGLWVESDSVLTATNNIVVANSAGSVAGALYVTNSQARLLHTTVASNTASTAYNGIIGATGSEIWLTNTILVSQTVGLATTGVGITVTADHTLWGVTGTYTDASGGGVIWTRADLVGTPGFVSATDYHITRTSAAIDAGQNAGIATDIDSQRRPNGSRFDLGADEFYYLPFPTYLPLIMRNN